MYMYIYFSIYTLCIYLYKYQSIYKLPDMHSSMLHMQYTPWNLKERGMQTSELHIFILKWL